MLQQTIDQLLLRGRVQHHLETIYHDHAGDLSLDELADDLLALMRLEAASSLAPGHINHWSQRDVLVISYGDSILRAGEKPLATLKRFLDEHCNGVISGVHILPFYPWSSDDGFAVLDY